MTCGKIPPQTILGDRYRIEDRIGIGGMAEVYHAHDILLNRSVAVKVMLPQFATDPDFTQRFYQEATAAAKLQSPHIVTIHDWGHDSETYYIVMELLDGNDLKTEMRAYGSFSQQKATEIGIQICKALSVAHSQGIIHRDISPQNVMLLLDGSIKVMDFGIAKVTNSNITHTATVLGNARYISPEQAQGKELSAASDLYSLGTVLYECLAGHPPFTSENALDTALMHVNETPLPLSQLDIEVDCSLESTVMRALAKNPADRFASAQEMQQSLEKCACINTPSGKAQAPKQAAASFVEGTKVMPVLGDAKLTSTTKSSLTKSTGGNVVSKISLSILAIAIIVCCILVARIQPWEPDDFTIEDVPSQEDVSRENDAYYHDRLLEAYNNLDKLDRKVRAAAQDFNKTYLSNDYATRQSNADSTKALCGELDEENQAINALGVPSSSGYYFAWTTLCTLYDCLMQRATVLHSVWIVDLSYQEPAAHASEITKPLQNAQDSTGNNKYLTQYEKLYPTVLVDGDIAYTGSEHNSNPSGETTTHDVENNYIAFDLPESWKDEVNVFYNGNDIYIRYKKDPTSERSLLAVYLKDASSPSNAGDIGNGRVYWYDNSKGQRIEIRTFNYAYMALSNARYYLGQNVSVTQSVMLDRSVIDSCIQLQTGGEVMLADILDNPQEAGNDLLFKHYEFFEEVVEPTIEVK